MGSLLFVGAAWNATQEQALIVEEAFLMRSTLAHWLIGHISLTF
jgi:hypothetical protein